MTVLEHGQALQAEAGYTYDTPQRVWREHLIHLTHNQPLAGGVMPLPIWHDEFERLGLDDGLTADSLGPRHTRIVEEVVADLRSEHVQQHWFLTDEWFDLIDAGALKEHIRFSMRQQPRNGWPDEAALSMFNFSDQTLATEVITHFSKSLQMFSTERSLSIIRALSAVAVHPNEFLPSQSKDDESKKCNGSFTRGIGLISLAANVVRLGEMRTPIQASHTTSTFRSASCFTTSKRAQVAVPQSEFVLLHELGHAVDAADVIVGSDGREHARFDAYQSEKDSTMKWASQHHAHRGHVRGSATEYRADAEALMHLAMDEIPETVYWGVKGLGLSEDECSVETDRAFGQGVQLPRAYTNTFYCIKRLQ